MDAYNYESFDFARDEQELAEWLRLGLPLGSVAPDFELEALGGGTVRLSALLGRPVVIEFGSYTCPIFSSRVAAMEQLAGDFPAVHFLVVYTREAHPGERLGRHSSSSGKKAAALRLVHEEGISRRVLLDTLDGEVHRAYGSAPNCCYVLDARGRIAIRLGWNDAALVRRTLYDMRSGGVPEAVERLGVPVSIYPLGHLLLKRGGRKALLDFYETCPAPVREALRASADPDVRALSCSVPSIR